jgi:hypothetical protein
VIGFNWQPIETAPRDGTRILVRSKNGAGIWTDPCVAWWLDGWKCSPGDDGQPMIVYHPPLEWVAVAWQEPKYHTYNKSELFEV